MSSWEWRLLRKGTRRPYRMVERRMVLEYLVTRCQGALFRKAHKRLGPTPSVLKKMYPNIPLSALRVYNPYGDAVCVFEDRIELIEFKIHDPMKGIAQLEFYRLLAQQDPELQKYLPRPIVLKLVYWRTDANIEALCKAKGIVFEVYHPPWLDPILREYGYIP